MKFAAVVFLVLAFSNVYALAGERRYIIGLVAPLSGANASWGVDVMNAVQFAREELGENFELVLEDDRCHAARAVTAAQKLIHIDQVDFAMVVCTESMLATAPLFERSRTVVIAPVASGAGVSDAGKYVFRTWPSDAVAAEMLSELVSRHHKRFGIISEARGYAEELALAAEDAFKPTNVNVFTERFSSEDTDLRSLLLRFKTLSVEGLLINANSSQTFLTILRQLRALNWDITIYGVYMPGSASFVREAGSLAEGIIFVDGPSISGTLTQDGRNLFDSFVKKYGPPNSAEFVFASTFEAVKLIRGLPSGKKASPDLLLKKHFDGIFGPYSFDENGDLQGVAHELKWIRNGSVRHYQRGFD